MFNFLQLLLCFWFRLEELSPCAVDMGVQIENIGRYFLLQGQNSAVYISPHVEVQSLFLFF